jgi:signal transduction histidine kinase/ligand-binding sensor domain-containing protein
MKRIFLILYLSLFMGITAHAQKPFVQYHTSDVYKAASVVNHYIRPDYQGNIYIANNEGALKYDGEDWEILIPPNRESIRSIAPDSLGSIYVGTDTGIGCFRKNVKGNYEFSSLNAKIPQRYRDQSIELVAAHKNSIFFFNSTFILRYENDTIRAYDIPNSGFVKLNGNFYISQNNELLRYSKGEFESQHISKHLGKIDVRWIVDHPKPNTILILDNNQQLWTFDMSPGLQKRLEPFVSDFQNYPKESHFYIVRTLDSGMIMLASDKEIIFLNQNGKIVYTYNVSQLGDFVTTRNIFKDRQHNLWLSSSDALIQIIASSPITFYDQRNGLKGVILSLGQTGPHRYVATGRGLFYQKNSTSFTRILDYTTWNIVTLENKLYASNYSGVYELQGEKAVRIVEMEAAMALCALKKHPGQMIVQNYEGLWLLKKQNNRWKKSPISGFQNEAYYLHEDNEGYIWASHHQKGIYRMQLNTSMDSVVSFTLYDTLNGLPSVFNNRIFKLNNDSVVATTEKGIYRYNKSKDRFESDDKTQSVLGRDFCVYSLAENPEGDLYFWGAQPGKHEIAGVLQKQNNGSYKALFTPFNKIAVPIQGLRVDVDAPILFAGSEDVLIGNNLKLIHYNPKQKTFYDEPIQTSIRHVWARDSVIHTHKQVPGYVSISHDYNSLKFDFSCSFYEDAEKTVYQHKLEGFENEWSDWSSSREAAYTNIPGGTYTFLVRSKNIYDVISAPAVFTFTIQFPWYQKWWAYVLYFILLTVIIWTIIYYYTQQIRLQKKLLQRLVNEKTKDLIAKNQEILNKNEEISMQAESLENLNLTKDKIFSIISHDLRGPIHQVQQMLNLLEYTFITEGDFKSVLPDLKESVRYTVSLTDNLLHWARNQMEGVKVKPSAFDIHEIIEENFRLFRPLATRKNIVLTNTFENHADVYADKDMIKLVIRNLVNNAIKFTDTTGRVEMGAHIKEKYIMVYITDTGKGIRKEDVSKILQKETFSTTGTQGERGVGLGLSLCQEFIEKNSGQLYIESELTKGSKFSFTIPISA